MDLIKFKNVTIGYNKSKILSNINFTIKEKDFICIVGPNGSGKSSLIKTLLGLIPTIEGEVIYANIKQNFIGYMPQDNKVDPNFPASVYEIVLSGCLNRLSLRPFYNKKEKQMAIDNLKLLKIEHLIDKKFCDLSGGQRQKVLLARSLCATNKLLILDEPSNNLDHTSKEELYEIIKQLNTKQNIAIIMITHDLDREELIGNKIISLKDNEFYFGNAKEYLND